MKHQVYILIFSVIIFFVSACSEKATEKKDLNNEVEVSEQIELTIDSLRNKIQEDTILVEKESKYPEINVVENQKLSSPYHVKVDSKGLWFAIEGELGIVKLVDGDNMELSSSILKSVDGNWMTSGSALFEANLVFNAKEAKKGILIITQNNSASEEEGGAAKSFQINVVF